MEARVGSLYFALMMLCLMGLGMRKRRRRERIIIFSVPHRVEILTESKEMVRFYQLYGIMGISKSYTSKRKRSNCN